MNISQAQLLILLNEALPQCHTLSKADWVYRCEKAVEEIERQVEEIERLSKMYVDSTAVNGSDEKKIERLQTQLDKMRKVMERPEYHENYATDAGRCINGCPICDEGTYGKLY